jgi:hypothetical protein
MRRRALAAAPSFLYTAILASTVLPQVDDQTPKGPHLVDIGKRYTPTELVESILKPSAKIAQGYESYSFAIADGRVFTGFVVSEAASTVQIRESVMPEGIAGNLTPEQLADLIAYLQSLK